MVAFEPFNIFVVKQTGVVKVFEICCRIMKGVDELAHIRIHLIFSRSPFATFRIGYSLAVRVNIRLEAVENLMSQILGRILQEVDLLGVLNHTLIRGVLILLHQLARGFILLEVFEVFVLKFAVCRALVARFY